MRADVLFAGYAAIANAPDASEQRTRWDLEPALVKNRLEAMTDGIYAIAMTLAVLTIIVSIIVIMHANLISSSYSTALYLLVPLMHRVMTRAYRKSQSN